MKGLGVGVFEPGFAEGLEAGDGGLLRVGDEAVDGFLAVDVGLVLEVAAESVADGLEHEAGDGDGEDENHEAGAGGEVRRGWPASVPPFTRREWAPSCVCYRSEAAKRQPGGKAAQAQ